jgi:uncharacterized protein YjbI with pentapeptide repeats
MSAFQWLAGDAEEVRRDLEDLEEQISRPVPRETPLTFLEQEIFSLLAEHKEWVESQGTAGKRLELSDVNFSGKDLAGVNLRNALLHDANFRGSELLLADLRGATLVQADFQGANLLGTEFRGANLQGTKFGGSTGLVARQFGGANLLGAELPETVATFDGLAAAAATYRKARRLFFVMLILSALSFLVVAFTRDVQLLRNLPLPLLGNSIPMVGFFFVMPFVLVLTYLFFHLALHRVGDRLSELPIVFPDGRPLEAAGPWERLGMVSSQIRHTSGEVIRPLSFLEKAISRALSDWVVPVSLLFFWVRYLVQQDMRATLLHIFLVAATTAFAVYVRWQAPKKPTSTTLVARILRWLPGIEKAFPPLKIAGAVGVFLLLLSIGAIYGAPHDTSRAPEYSSASVRRWAADLLWVFDYDPFAHLTESSVSTRPKSWTGRDEEVAQVHGAGLNKSNLRYAEAYRSFWVNAHLWAADFQGASLSESDFRGANLRQANLRSAVLDRAAMAHTNLQGANLVKANLARTDLREADLSFATLSEAVLVEAVFDGAKLFSADLRGVRAPHVNFEKADLRDAHLEGADLTQSDLQEAYLWSAKLPEARLQDAQLQRAILIEANLQKTDLRGAIFQATIVRGADLAGANLDGADLRGAIGLTADQVCSAASRRAAQLDDALQAQVDTQCGSLH